MRILIDGQIIMLHFFHDHPAARRLPWSHRTVATIHPGPCPEGRERGKPCPIFNNGWDHQTNQGIGFSYGVAKCSKKDPFDKRKGRALALTRAMRGVAWLPRSVRGQVWWQYRQRYDSARLLKEVS